MQNLNQFYLLSSYKGNKNFRGKSYASFGFIGFYRGIKITEVLYFGEILNLKENEEYLLHSELVEIIGQKILAKLILLKPLEYMKADIF